MKTRTEFYQNVESTLAHIAVMESHFWAVRQIVSTGERLGFIVVYERERD